MFNLMHNAGDQDQKKGPDPVSLVYLIVAGHTACFTPFLRRDFGTEAFRSHGPAALAAIVIYGSLANCYAMWPFLWIWFAVLLMQRLRTAMMHRRGVVQHSRYGGYPWVALRLCRFVRKERTARVAVEPLICLAVGTALMPVSEHLGGFILLGGLSMMVKSGIERSLMQARVRTLRDGEMEQRYLNDVYHGRTDDY